jgi:hypothetical protein
MEKSSWEARSHTAGQEIFARFMEPDCLFHT